MEGLFLEILNMSISASWLILAVVIIRFFMKNAPKGFRYLLWALVAVRLMCPFSFESALSMIPSAETFSEESIYSDTPEIHSGVAIIDDTVNPILTKPDIPKEEGSPVVNHSGNASEGNVVIPENTGNHISNNNIEDPIEKENGITMTTVINTVSWVWLIGLFLMCGYALVSYIRLRVAVRISVKKENNLWLCDEIDSPFILGLVHPHIYMPSDIDEAQVPYILAHEKEHLRYRDNWWKLLGFIILSIHWFNPFVWVAYILLCRDIELACDERVIKDMDEEEKRNYSRSLLLCSNPRHMISACPVAFGEIGIKERIQKVLDYKKPSTWIVGIGVVVCMIVAICFMTNPAGDKIIGQMAGAVKIELHDGNNGKMVEITDAEYIARITENVASMEFERKGSAVGTGGWSYWLKWYDAEGNELENLIILSENRVRVGNYFYEITKGAFETEFFDELLRNAGQEIEGEVEFEVQGTTESVVIESAKGTYVIEVSNPILEDELNWFESEFFNNYEIIMPKMFLTSEYDCPENIDLYALFYSGVLDGDRENPTEAEIGMLKTKYRLLDTTFMVKISADKMDEILSEYMNITLDETNKVGLDQFYYLEEYDAYYNIAADVWSQEINVEQGWKNEEEGTITLQYSLENESGTCYYVILKEDNGDYDYVFHMKAGDFARDTLSEEELIWFSTEFFNSDENRMPNMFLAREFDSPENLDIGNTFHGGADGVGGGEISEEEERLLLELYYDEALLDVSKTTAAEMDAILMQYMGITLADTNKVNLDGLYYLDEYDAYYNVAGDTEYSKYILSFGWINEDGTISIQYKDAFEEPADEYIVTLKEVDGTYQFISNIKIEYSDTTQ